MPRKNVSGEVMAKERAEYVARERDKIIKERAEVAAIKSKAETGEEIDVWSLARATGNTMVSRPPLVHRVSASPAHAAASARHGWAQHAHHAGGPMKLTLKDYESAIAAAQKSQAHPPAISKYAPAALRA